MINDILERYTQDLIDTSLKYIDNTKKLEFLVNCIQITLFHKAEIEIYLKNKQK
jgi:hypothetical protein